MFVCVCLCVCAVLLFQERYLSLLAARTPREPKGAKGATYSTKQEKEGWGWGGGIVVFYRKYAQEDQSTGPAACLLSCFCFFLVVIPRSLLWFGLVWFFSAGDDGVVFDLNYCWLSV